MYAIAQIKGFQYKVQKGDTLRVPRYDLEVGKKVSIHEVMLVVDAQEVKVGAPYVENAVVKATVSGHDKYDKITVFKKKRRKDYSVKRGHRQEYTELLIDSIAIGKPKSSVKRSAKAKDKVETPAKKTPDTPDTGPAKKVSKKK
ncbi:50S ribosomal protein L21 [Candidatus Latescibacterota bacterium]